MAEAKKTPYYRDKINKTMKIKHILTFSETHLENFLLKLLVGDTIYLDKYLIKIICVLFLYGINSKQFMTYSNVGYFSTLLFTIDDFFTPTKQNKKKFTFGHININELSYISQEIATSLSIFMQYLGERVNNKLQAIKKNKDNNISQNFNEEATLLSLINHNDKIENIKFAYNFIDYSELKDLRRQKAMKTKNNSILFKPALIYYYFIENLDKFFILAGNDNNLLLLKKLIHKMFVDDCIFDQSNFDKFYRYVNSSNNNSSNNNSSKNIDQKQRLLKVQFSNNTKTHNSGKLPKRKPKQRHTSEHNNVFTYTNTTGEQFIHRTNTSYDSSNL